MQTNFKSLIELNDFFKEEKTCYEFLASQIWDEGKPVCPHCGGTHIYTTKGRSTNPAKKDIPEYRCANKECAKKFTATVGTVFHASKISLRTWFAAIYLITTSKKGISSLQLSSQLNVTQKTAWHLLHRIRNMFKDTAPDMLKGVVEVDETFVGGKQKNRHENKRRDYEKDGDEKIPVLGLVERGGKILTFVVPNTQSAILQPIMVEHVDTSALVITDYHQGYVGLNNTFNHVRVKAEQGSHKTDRHFHTNNIENFWSIFKRGIIGIYHNVSAKHLHRYTTEFGYRYNYRKEPTIDKFHNVVRNSANNRLSYDKLVDKGVSKQTLDTISIQKLNKGLTTGYEHLDNI